MRERLCLIFNARYPQCELILNWVHPLWYFPEHASKCVFVVAHLHFILSNNVFGNWKLYFNHAINLSNSIIGTTRHGCQLSSLSRDLIKNMCHSVLKRQIQFSSIANIFSISFIYIFLTWTLLSSFSKFHEFSI